MSKEHNHDLVCKFGNVKGPSEWDKFDYEAPSPLYEAEIKAAPKGVVISIQKEASLGRRLRVNVKSRKGFTDAELKRHQSAMVLVEKVVNSLEWKNAVLKKKFSTTKKTAQQVYDHMMTGAEVLQPGKDYEMDAEIEMYYQKNNVVGYTYSNVNTTWINRYVTADYLEEDIAGNFFHEWLHKLGYGHASASDHSSVPYALGYLIRDMIKKYKAGMKLVDLYPEIIVTVPLPTTNAPVVTSPTGPIPAPNEPKIPVAVPTPEPKKVCSRPWYYLGLITVCYYEK